MQPAQWNHQRSGQPAAHRRLSQPLQRDTSKSGERAPAARASYLCLSKPSALWELKCNRCQVQGGKFAAESRQEVPDGFSLPQPLAAQQPKIWASLLKAPSSLDCPVSAPPFSPLPASQSSQPRASRGHRKARSRLQTREPLGREGVAWSRGWRRGLARETAAGKLSVRVCPRLRPSAGARWLLLPLVSPDFFLSFSLHLEVVS